MTKHRVGRFEVEGSFEAPLEYAFIEITCDHANGDAKAYTFPGIKMDDARDLIHALERALRRADV